MSKNKKKKQNPNAKTAKTAKTAKAAKTAKTTTPAPPTEAAVPSTGVVLFGALCLLIAAMSSLMLVLQALGSSRRASREDLRRIRSLLNEMEQEEQPAGD